MQFSVRSLAFLVISLGLMLLVAVSVMGTGESVTIDSFDTLTCASTAIASGTVTHLNGTAAVNISFTLTNVTQTTVSNVFSAVQSSGTHSFSLPIPSSTALGDSMTLTIELLDAGANVLATDSLAYFCGPGRLSVDSPAMSEGTIGQFTVTLSYPSTQTITVDYVITNGTAQAGLDFTAQMIGTLNFASGQTVQTIPVNVLADGLSEPAETFNVNLNNVFGPATIWVANGVATIGGTPSAAPGCVLNDGRLNNDPARDCAAPVALYCVGDQLRVYKIDPATSQGHLIMNESMADLEAMGVPTGANQLLVENEGVLLSRLTSGFYQVNTWSYDPYWPNQSKPYTLSFDGCPATTVYHIDF